MAKRPIFIPAPSSNSFVDEQLVEFSWHPGFAPSQKLKNIRALHLAAEQLGIDPILEISSKSDVGLGHRLSAFNLEIELPSGKPTQLEAAFQGSKRFKHGGPYQDLYGASPLEAKRDARLRSSGPLLGFRLEDIEFAAQPATGFYDWLYARALQTDQSLLQQLSRYAGFTDIEFNPRKSLNCQARACARCVALYRSGRLTQVVTSVQAWTASYGELNQDDAPVQGDLF